jgi:hypothetical protein
MTFSMLSSLLALVLLGFLFGMLVLLTTIIVTIESGPGVIVAPVKRPPLVGIGAVVTWIGGVVRLAFVIVFGAGRSDTLPIHHSRRGKERRIRSSW